MPAAARNSFQMRLLVVVAPRDAFVDGRVMLGCTRAHLIRVYLRALRSKQNAHSRRTVRAFTRTATKAGRVDSERSNLAVS